HGSVQAGQPPPVPDLERGARGALCPRLSQGRRADRPARQPAEVSSCPPFSRRACSPRTTRPASSPATWQLPLAPRIGFLLPSCPGYDGLSPREGRTHMRIFLCAGEPSGDVHGANLVRALRARRPDVECVGFGGERMEAAGCRLLYPLCRLAVMW